MPDQLQLHDNAANTNKTCRAHAPTLAVSKPSENNMISQICSKSGTTMVTGRKRAFRLSGSSVRPAYPGFMVMKIPLRSSRAISLPAQCTHKTYNDLQGLACCKTLYRRTCALDWQSPLLSYITVHKSHSCTASGTADHAHLQMETW